MTKSTCLRHPENEPLVIIRQWQVAICEGNTCTASLLSFFEYWHSIKLEMREKAQYANAVAARHGEAGHHDETLIQFHTSDDLERGLMGLYKADTIRKAIKYLEKRGFIEQVKNPNPRYSFDKTRHFQFCVDKVANALDDYLRSRSKGKQEEKPTENLSQKNPVSPPKNRTPYPKNLERHPKNRGAIPEITTETSTEISFESYSSPTPPSTAPPIATANTVSVAEWPRPEQIFLDLEFLHGVDPMFAELQFVEFRSWWRDKERFTPGEWDAKFLQRCVDQWDLRLIRQRGLLEIDRRH
jgi:hypothetical protein